MMTPHTKWQLMQRIEVSAIKEMEAQTGVQLDFSVTDDPELYPLLTDPNGVSTVGIPGLRFTF